jgi:hypothetical protein
MKFNSILLLFVCLLLSGCRHGYPAARVYYRNMMSSVLSNPEWYGQYYSEKDPEKRKQIRNQLIGYCVWLADDNFNAYATKFNRNQSITGLIFDWSSLAASGASTIVTPAALFGAIATGLQGAHASYDRNVLDQQTRGVILLKMEALRQDRLVEIYQSEQLSDQQYSLIQGLIDVQQYVNAGTVHAALASISEDVSIQHKNSSTILKQVR